MAALDKAANGITGDSGLAAIRPLQLTAGGEDEKILDDTVTKAFNIIYAYRLQKSADAHDKWVEGTPKFLSIIKHYVRTKSVIRRCMPAFPFKSANKNFKVLGTLPDRAEQVALTRLNIMCAEIEAIYKSGAKLLIISDGLVYNDLLTIPDKDVWAYGQELRGMGVKTTSNIEFSRLQELVVIDLPPQLDEITYVATASNFRRALFNQFGRDNLDVRKIIKEHEDTRLTYCGHSRFLFNDLRSIFLKSEARGSNKYKRDVKFPAREMIRRGFAFSAAIKKNFLNHLRLSIHQSIGEHKISLSLLPIMTTYTTPWMCAIAYHLDGILTSAPKGELKAEGRYELVHENGRPSYYQEIDQSCVLQEKSASGFTMVNQVTNGGTNQVDSPSCPQCGKSHAEARCFDKYPHLAPKWYQKVLAARSSPATPAVEVDENVLAAKSSASMNDGANGDVISALNTSTTGNGVGDGVSAMTESTNGGTASSTMIIPSTTNEQELMRTDYNENNNGSFFTTYRDTTMSIA